MISLKECLRRIHDPGIYSKIPEPYKSIPHGYFALKNNPPHDLKDFVKLTHSSQIQGWNHQITYEYPNLSWSNECQGESTDGNYLYVVSNNPIIDIRDFDEENPKRIMKGLYKCDWNYNILGYVNFPTIDHIGAPAYHNKNIYIPVAGGKLPRVWVVDSNFTNQKIYDLGHEDMGEKTEQTENIPWLAYDPVSGYLYSSEFGDDDPAPYVDRVFAYDPDFYTFAYRGAFKLEDQSRRVQGGCFSKNGHLYLSVDSHKHDSGTIKSYSILTGKFLGDLYVPYSNDMTYGEVEGINIVHLSHKEASDTYVNLTILDNDVFPNRLGDVYIFHYSVPDPTVLW